MRNATFFVALLTLLASAGAAQASEQAANPGANPLIFLPGMNIRYGAALPAGASIAPSAHPALPFPLVSEFTNAPNPFDARKENTTIAYLLARDSDVTLTLYDLLGVKLRSWTFSAGQSGGRAGGNEIPWDGTNAAHQKVSKGGYLAQMEVSGPEGTATVLRKIGLIH